MSHLVDTRHRHALTRDVRGITLFIGVVWLVFLFDRVLPLEQLGLVPRRVDGLIGIVAMPFLHADLSHLIGNTIPLTVTLLLMAGSRANTPTIVALIGVLAGSGLWLFGRTALHIGASGLVFGLIAFHLCAGLFERRLSSVLIAAVVGLMYGSTLIGGVLPFQPGVSWDGHAIGAFAGLIVAAIVARQLRIDDRNDDRPRASATQG